MNLAPTSSTTAALAVGDALAIALLELRGLRPEDYAALHPRGTLGWRALFRVADLMHTGEAIPLVRLDATLAQVVEEMSRKGLGMTTVVDDHGHLAGVITDGDLRRMLGRGGSPDALRARDVATRAPRTIRPDELAARALEMMEGRITSLIVAGEDGAIVGVVHLHDILRAKIV